MPSKYSLDEFQRLPLTFETFSEAFLPRVEAEIRKAADGWPKGKPLYDAMRYSLLAGGKRMRPLTMLACAYAVGGPAAVRRVLHVAPSIEMVHVFTLIHDDLPEMDDSDVRWNKPTCHKVFGEDIALLAGDALLNEAYRHVLALASSVFSRKQGREVMSALSSAVAAVVYGQMLDLGAEGKRITPEALKEIHLSKTAALLEATCVIGGIAGRATGGQLAALRGFGCEMGLAYQIRDDLLMFEGDEKALGKPVDLDERKRKATYPRLLGIEKSHLQMEAARERAVSHLRGVKVDKGLLSGLLDFAIARVK